MDLPEAQLRRILAGDDSFVGGDEARQHVEESGLARPGASGHDDVQARFHRRVEVRHDRGGGAAGVDDLVRAEHLSPELADSKARTVDGHRWDDYVDARAVLESRVTHRLGFVDAAADRGNNAVDHATKAPLVFERQRGQLDLSAPLDEYLLRPVHHHLADVRVPKQRFKRSQADDLVEQDLDQPLLVRRCDERSWRLGPKVLFGQLKQETADAGSVVDIDLGGVMRKKLRVDLGFGGRQG